MRVLIGSFLFAKDYVIRNSSVFLPIGILVAEKIAITYRMKFKLIIVQSYKADFFHSEFINISAQGGLPIENAVLAPCFGILIV